ncbi:barstar family protein [Flavobacterium buctense]|uniref:Barstar family protein n=1 Tax=Flavobacterium buctense TaxID=1648146 RepID=A0ABU9E3L7_9FLAO|nr:barstar family protein [Flavobacterium buctense]
MENLENSPEKWKKLRDEKVDLGIMGKGFLSLYYKEDIINYDIDLLQKKKYKIVEFDCNDINSDIELHFALQGKQNFLDYVGENFAALDDCLIDYEIDNNGVVVVFRHLNNLDLESIYSLLDIFATHARRKFVIGQKLLVLIQVDNPKFKIIQPIGAVNFYLWNDKEWFEGERL